MSSTDPSSRFISESAIDEARKEREEAWKQAYKAGDAQTPMPGTEYDPRTLFEQLQEQKNKKNEAYEESRRFASSIRKLDADETEFLDTVDELEKKKWLEQRQTESLALSEFKEKVAERQAKPAATRRAAAPPGRALSIASKISGAIHRRTQPSSPAAPPAAPTPKRPDDGRGDASDSSRSLKRHKHGAASPRASPAESDALGLLAAYASDGSESP
ncbi:hypothetical protein LPJ61_002609 [Coemansia biformis]|uniref:FAM192A/Fyv6 N-terminal domain-containing protein n=1 Tax=Coemansia biformis TaxID=1286918 RepID=A0A9W7YE66_9FUNG|nr:hypothetical protein LPJ61_002609 [Coemansia biformis]